MEKIVAKIAWVFARMTGKPGSPVIGVSVAAPKGWVEYCRNNPKDLQA